MYVKENSRFVDDDNNKPKSNKSHPLHEALPVHIVDLKELSTQDPDTLTAMRFGIHVPSHRNNAVWVINDAGENDHVQIVKRKL